MWIPLPNVACILLLLKEPIVRYEKALNFHLFGHNDAIVHVFAKPKHCTATEFADFDEVRFGVFIVTFGWVVLRQRIHCVQLLRNYGVGFLLRRLQRVSSTAIFDGYLRDKQRLMTNQIAHRDMTLTCIFRYCRIEHLPLRMKCTGLSRSLSPPYTMSNGLNFWMLANSLHSFICKRDTQPSKKPENCTTIPKKFTWPSFHMAKYSKRFEINWNNSHWIGSFKLVWFNNYSRKKGTRAHSTQLRPQNA